MVAYVGHPGRGLDIGDEGLVLSSSGSACHVRWESGGLTGQITLTATNDLVPGEHSSPSAKHAYTSIEDAFGEDALVSCAVRDVYEAEGEAGLLQALAQEGHLTTLADAVEEAVGVVATRIRQDPSFQTVLGQLDDHEGDNLVNLAAVMLVREAFDKEA